MIPETLAHYTRVLNPGPNRHYGYSNDIRTSMGIDEVETPLGRVHINYIFLALFNRSSSFIWVARNRMKAF